MTIGKNAFIERERALENEFFFEVDRKLLSDLRERMALEEDRQAIAAVVGVEDASLVDELVELGVKPETFAAIGVIPLVLVAWSSRHMPERERLTVLHAAEAEGIPDGSPAHRLLEHWLGSEPNPKLGHVWEHYILELSKLLTLDALASLKNEVMTRARAVAKSAHSRLGVGRLADEEKQILQRLEAVFEEPRGDRRGEL